jgi:hypothetical protein
MPALHPIGQRAGREILLRGNPHRVVGQRHRLPDAVDVCPVRERIGRIQSCGVRSVEQTHAR